jgi:phage terminase large subunit-like protein
MRRLEGGHPAVSKSYDQGRVAFQGTEREVVYLDEEPPKDVYDECLLRTMTTNGIVLCTFTPLLGLSDVALSFLPELAPAV